MIFCIFLLNLPSDAIGTSMLIIQHWFKLWFGAVRQQVIIWTNIDRDFDHVSLLIPLSLAWPNCWTNNQVTDKQCQLLRIYTYWSSWVTAKWLSLNDMDFTITFLIVFLRYTYFVLLNEYHRCTLIVASRFWVFVSVCNSSRQCVMNTTWPCGFPFPLWQ